MLLSRIKNIVGCKIDKIVKKYETDPDLMDFNDNELKKLLKNMYREIISLIKLKNNLQKEYDNIQNTLYNNSEEITRLVLSQQKMVMQQDCRIVISDPSNPLVQDLKNQICELKSRIESMIIEYDKLDERYKKFVSRKKIFKLDCKIRETLDKIRSKEDYISRLQSNIDDSFCTVSWDATYDEKKEFDSILEKNSGMLRLNKI